MSNSLKFHVKETGYTPKLAKKKLREINVGTVYAMGEYWHDNFRAKHFTPAGAREYGYAPRNVPYMIRKAKKWGHRDPLVWSGTSRALSRIKQIVATGTSVRARANVILRTPALNFIPKGGRINMRDEMTRTSQRESDVLSRVGAEARVGILNSLTDSSSQTIG